MLKKSAVIEAKFRVVVNNKTLLKAHTLTEQGAGGDASNKIFGEGTTKLCNVKMRRRLGRHQQEINDNVAPSLSNIQIRHMR